MNAGGIHVFYGVGFLLLCWLITYFYLAVVYVLLSGVRYFFSKEKEHLIRKCRNNLLWLGIGLLVLLIGANLQQRIVWMGGENKFYSAKEYWVAGRVVNIPRKALDTFFYIDSPVIQPYSSLLRKIYNAGINLLPKYDGERYVWFNDWFVYPYAHGFERPRGVGSKKYEPEMVHFLDSCWEAMNKLTTNEIADPDMRRKHLLSFPFLVSYYSTFQGHYTGKYTSSGTRTRTHSLYRHRNYQMLDWLDALEKIWQKENIYPELLKKYPYVVALHQVTILELLQNISLSLPLEGTFRCDHPIILRLYKELQDIMSNDLKLNSLLYLKRKSKKKADTAYSTTVYSPTGSGSHYLLARICKMQMPQELKVLRDEWYSSHHWPDDSIERIFKEELKPLLER